MSQHFYPVSVWSFGKIPKNPPKTQHPSAVQTLQHTQTETGSMCPQKDVLSVNICCLASEFVS